MKAIIITDPERCRRAWEKYRPKATRSLSSIDRVSSAGASDQFLRAQLFGTDLPCHITEYRTGTGTFPSAGL